MKYTQAHKQRIKKEESWEKQSIDQEEMIHEIRIDRCNRSHQMFPMIFAYGL